MVNFGWNSASILGVFLMVVGAGLYFLRSVRPELSRDYDIFFAAVGLACGGILVFNGWRLDPILQFGQFLLASSTIFFAVESIRLRGVATEQARRNTPVVDDDRPVSRSYRAYREPEYSDYDQIEPYDTERRAAPRQLRGSQEERSSRRDRYDAETRSRSRRPSSNGSSYERPERPEQRPPERPERPERSPRPRPPATERYAERDVYPPADAERYSDRYDEWGEPYDEPPAPRSRPSARDGESRERPPRRPRPERPLDPFQDEEPAPYVDYVDYRPDEDEEDFEREPERPRPAPPPVYDNKPGADDDDGDDSDEDYIPRAGSEY